MFTHIMIGSNNLERSRAFYDATFTALGGKPGERDERGRLIYDHDGGRLMITRPIDGHPATVANGGTAHGGASIETPPCERPNGVFVAYLRDPDGHKLTARTKATR